MQSLQEIQLKASRFLARREYCEHELVRKLVSRGAEQGLAEQAVGILKDRNLVNDERFAEHLVRVRMARGYGPVKIRAELKERGVSPDLISTCLDVEEQVWHCKIKEVAERKYRNETMDNFRDWSKRARFFQSRGFTSSQIRQALGDFDE